MPLNNSFYGVYKFVSLKTNSPTLGIGKNPYVVESIDIDNSESVAAKFYMQGTPLVKVLDIGSTKEDIKVKAPILVPEAGYSIMDGLRLLWDMAALQYTNGIPNNFLPLMSSVTINIGSNDSSINFDLISDGDPNNSTNVYEINYGTTAQNYIQTTGLDRGSRVAKNYDFCVDFGGFKYFVENCTVAIKVNNSEHKFLGVYGQQPPNQTVPFDGLNNGVWDPGTDTELASYSGWQFPFLAMGGIEITITGTAVISIDDTTGATTNWQYNDTVTSDVNELIERGNVTLQPTGVFRYTQDNFNIYYTGNDDLSAVLPPAFAVNKAIVEKRGAKFSDKEMKADFTVKAFAGI